MHSKIQISAISSLTPRVPNLLALAVAAFLLTGLRASADNLHWDSNGNTAGFGNTTGTWGTNAFWNDNPSGDAPTVAFTAATTSSDTVNFGTATLKYDNGTIGVEAGGVSAAGIVFGAGQTRAITALGTSGNTITIHGGGITKNSGSAALSFISGITLGADQTWTNNSANTLEVAENVISPNVNFVTNAGFQLTIDGPGDTLIGRSNNTNHISISGSGALVKNGTGLLQLGGNNSASFSGKVTINGGSVNYGDSPGSLGTGNIEITNGALDSRWTNTFTRTQGTSANQIQITGGVSGFGGAGGGGTTYNLGNIVWGSATFNPTEFILNSVTTADNKSANLTSNIDLGGAARTIRSDQSPADPAKGRGTFSGIISNGGIIKRGIGQLVFAGANTYSGGTTIEAGTLQLDNNSALGSTSGELTLNGGLLNINNMSAVIVGNLTGTGGIIANNGADDRTLTIGSGDATGGNFQGAIADTTAADSGTLSLTKTGTGTMTLSGNNTYTGPTTISAGTLQIGASGTTGSLATSGVTNNSTLIYDRSDDFSVDYTISGSGAFIKQGAGTMTFSSPSIQSSHITISEGVLQFDQANVGNQAGAMTIAETGASLHLNFSGTQALDALYIGETKMPSAVYKAIGSPADGIELTQITGPGTLSATGDVYPPTVVSITSDIDTYAVASGAEVTYTITFNEDIDSSTVSSDDFTNAGTATITVGAITEISPGVFTVVITPTGAGTLQLAIPAGATLLDASGNGLDTSSAVIPVDGTVPVYVPSSGLPEFVAASPVATSVGSSITMEMPAGAAPGDVLVALVVNYTSGIPSNVIESGTGWVYEKGGFMAGQYSDRIEFLSREVQEGDGPTFTLGLGGGAPYSAGGVILAFRNMDKTDNNWAPFAGGGPSTIKSEELPSTSASEPSLVYVNRADSLVVLLGVAVTDSAVNWSDWAFGESRNAYEIGTPDEILDASASSGTQTFSFGAANTIFEAPYGATANGMATLSGEAYSAAIQFQFKPLVNDSLYAALTELKAHVTGDTPLSSVQIGNHIDTIIAGKYSFSSNINSIAAAMDLVHTYDQELGPLWVARDVPNRNELQDDIHHAVFHVMQKLMDRSFSATNLSNHYDLFNNFSYGSSANFPGSCPAPADPDQTHTALIDGDYPNTWGREVLGQNNRSPKPTGTYLAPGSVATVTVPASLVGRGYYIRVGAHVTDFEGKADYFPDNSAGMAMKRLDRCTVAYPIVSTVTQVANPLGGGIYIEVPKYIEGVGVVSVEIQNAVRSPYFSAKSFHQTTLSEWQNIERHHSAPWADFQSEKVMMQVPTDWIYALEDPVTLMADWDRSVDILNDFMGFPRDRGRETIYNQVDLQLRAIAFTPGYPAVNNTYNPNQNYGGYANSYLLRGPQYAPFQEFHELGHAYKFPKFPGEDQFDVNERESDVNLLHVAVFEQGFGYSFDEAFRRSISAREYATLDTTAIAWMMCDNFLNGAEGTIMQSHEKQYALKGHAKFVEVARLFGWERLSNYFESFNEDYENGVAVIEEVDPLLLRLSKETGIDMRPLFHFWGVPPVNASALNSSVQAGNLPSSGLIYDTLVHYKSLVPPDNASFRTFANGWWGGQPSSTGFSEERNHADRWVNYDAAMATATAVRAQEIIDLYFPGGRPSDYGDWRSQWTEAVSDLVDPLLDLDGDGMSNENERIWGLDPTDGSSRNPINFNPSLKASGSFTYTRRNQARTGLNYSVWTSTDLKNWTEDTGAEQTPGTLDSNDVRTVETDLSPELLDSPTLFIQLRTNE